MKRRLRSKKSKPSRKRRSRFRRNRKSYKSCHLDDLTGICLLLFMFLPLLLYLGERYTCRNEDKLLYLMTETHKILEEHGVEYFLDYGTLLGFVRDGGPLPWDYDLDIGILTNHSNVLREIKEEYSRKRIFIEETTAPMCFRFIDRKHRLGLDVWCYDEMNLMTVKERNFWRPPYSIHEDTKMMCTEVLAKSHARHRFGSCKEKDTIYPLQQLTVEDQNFWIPNDSIQILKNTYGKWEERVTYLRCYHVGYPIATTVFYCVCVCMLLINGCLFWNITMNGWKNHLLFEKGVEYVDDDRKEAE